MQTGPTPQIALFGILGHCDKLWQAIQFLGQKLNFNNKKRQQLLSSQVAIVPLGGWNRG